MYYANSILKHLKSLCLIHYVSPKGDLNDLMVIVLIQSSSAWLECSFSLGHVT